MAALRKGAAPWIAAVTFVSIAAGFALVTWAALESAEVVVLRTFDVNGIAFDSRVWIADDASGTAWIEAAEPEKPFYLRLVARPEVELVRQGELRSVHAVPVPGEDAHRRIRAMLAAKYGWRDRWIGVLVDTSRSVAVRLEPVGPAPEPLSRPLAGVR